MVIVGLDFKNIQSTSRRKVTGLLATTSILVSRPVADLLTIAVDTFSVGVSLLIIYQTVGGGDALASTILTLTLFVYLVYAYTPDLYQEQFGDVVEARGFRGLTAVITLWIGTVFGRLTEFIPDVGVFVLLPGTPGAILVILITSTITVALLFSVYLHLVRDDRLSSEQSNSFELYESFSVSSMQKEVQEVHSLPERRRRVIILIGELTKGAVHALPAVALGVAIATVGLLSPIPETLIIAALLGAYIPLDEQLTGLLPNRYSGNVEFRVADNTTDAIQNYKGFQLTVLSIVGIGLSGGTVVAGIGILLNFATIFSALGIEFISSPNIIMELTCIELAMLVLLLWSLVGIVASWVTYALYSLLYWFRQLQRLPLYANFWQAYHQDGSSLLPVPSTMVTRPLGLFLPGNALFIGLGTVLWLIPNLDSDSLMISLMILIGWGVVWPVLIGIVIWSTRYHDSPQIIAGETRDVIIAICLQSASISISVRAWGVFIDGTLLAALIGIIAISYLPEVKIHSDGQQGLRGHLDWFYNLCLSALLLLLIEYTTEIDLLLPTLILGSLLLISLIVRIVEETNN